LPVPHQTFQRALGFGSKKQKAALVLRPKT